MARNKTLIERGRLVVTDAGGDVVLAAQISKKYAGRIDVHLEGFIAHMDYDQAKSEFKKVGVNSESFEQAFSKLKKNPGNYKPFDRKEKFPFHSGSKCYACDEPAIGFREMYGKARFEYACTRHADPKIKVYEACIYCDDPVRKGSIDTGIGFAHHQCHKEACK